ncbi:MAG: YegP family protein [Halobacteriaceae archaeon]
MAAEEDALAEWYESRIGSPKTDDEVYGYWVFVGGVLVGVVGIALFLLSTSLARGGTFWTVRGLGIALAGLALPAIVTGFVVRLPLRRGATLLTYAGAALSLLAIVWFWAAYPGNLGAAAAADGLVTLSGTAVGIVLLYTLGLLVQVAGGVFIPMGTTPAEEAVGELEAELDEFRAALADTEADEADLAAVVADLRAALADAAADEEDIDAVADDLRAALADAEADEADLAAELSTLRESNARFELYEDKGGEYRWRLRHRNGQIIATGGEGYSSRRNARQGILSVRRNALGAGLLEVERERLDAGGEPIEEPSDARFEVYGDEGGEYRWRLVHQNGELLADSGEGYTSRESARRRTDTVARFAERADYLRVDPTAFEVYRDAAGEWRWRLVHRNGRVLADSGEGYGSRSAANDAAERVAESVADAEVVEGERSGAGDHDGTVFEVYEEARGDWRWRLVHANGEIIADPGEGYSSRSGVEDAIDRIREYAPEADRLEFGDAAFELYEDSAGKWRWRLRRRNGDILADSGEGYGSRSGARDGIDSVKRHAPGAETTDG